MSDGAIVPAKKHWAAARADGLIGRLESAAATPRAIAPYVARTGSVVGHLAIASTVAIALGAADAAFGPEPGGFSTDGALAIGALALAVATSGSAASEYALTNGVMLSGMFLRRKTTELMTMRGGGTKSGDTSAPTKPQTPEEDPIVQKGKEL